MTNTNNSTSELMSKLIDGEISELELHRLLRAADENDEVRSHWSELNLQQSALNEHVDANLGLDLANRIRAEIGDEVLVDEAPTTVQKLHARWLKPAGQFAVAAAVAALVVVISPLTQTQSDEALIPGFQSVDEPLYSLNAELALPQLATRQVSTQISGAPLTLSSTGAPAGHSIIQPNGAILQSPEEQQRIQLLMSEYLRLHVERAGPNTASSVRTYLQAAPE
ncbi:sigma-E factor negative regulatory protein [Umboniibacter marinipuniceus]|uniref:Sigma-E factor negative regulatory protein RseA n=1 Tax=Umboniibacter marinipuniceus TaxID=569599 RepID=A0A3M0A3Y6_9GAMM|nr:sigma-E factor negative regulatory protein [Umboniibacter marinipuniceus]RMA79327.1 sigma-E factor negative regulatory protein RseA [Umboniibacter marinipuniceus]